MSLVLRYRRLLLIVVVPVLIFLLLAAVTEDLMLKSIINMMRVAVSAGICAAYAPGAVTFVLSDEAIEPADWLGYGIVLTWLASFAITMFNIVWIAHGEPMAWVNTDVTNAMYFVSVGGGVCHLFAPGALKHQIPTRRWVQVGIAVAIAVFLSFAAAWLADLPVSFGNSGSGYDGHETLPTPHGE